MIIVILCLSTFSIIAPHVKASSLDNTLVVYIGAHPDDIDIGMSGSLYKHDVGIHPILWIVVTDGGADQEEYNYETADPKNWISEDGQTNLDWKTPDGGTVKRSFYSADLSRKRCGGYINGSTWIDDPALHDSSFGIEYDWRTRVRDLVDLNVEKRQLSYSDPDDPTKRLLYPDGALAMAEATFTAKIAEDLAYEINQVVQVNGYRQDLLYINAHAPEKVADNSNEHDDHKITGNAVLKAIQYLHLAYDFIQINATWYTIYNPIQPKPSYSRYDENVAPYKTQKSNLCKACWETEFINSTDWDFYWNDYPTDPDEYEYVVNADYIRREIPEFPLIGQDTPKSCWAASSQMVLEYYGLYGPDVSQLQIAREVGSEFFHENGLPILLIGLWQGALERLGKLDTYIELGALTFDQVIEDINHNRPIIALVAGDLWIIPNIVPEHAMVIVGYIDNPGEADDQVIVYDPLPVSSGDRLEVPWTFFKGILFLPANALRTRPQLEKQEISIQFVDTRSSGILRFIVSSETWAPWWTKASKWGGLIVDTWQSIPGIPDEVGTGKRVIDIDIEENGPGNYRLLISATSLVETTWNVRVEQTAKFVPIDLILVLDRSGSMSGWMGGKTKMQGAKDSAIAVVDSLMLGDRVAVVSFSSSGTVNVHLTEDFDYAKTEIQKINAGGMTSFGAGMSLALNELKTHGSADHAWAIIFMSNGWHNTAPSPNPHVAECKDLDIPIYTVGLGDSSGNVNEPLLKWMASETEGKYLFAPSLFELQNIFLRFSLEVTGWTPIAEFSGIVYEDQTLIAGTFDVAPFTAFTRVTLNWPGSDLDIIILRPDGSEVDLVWGIDNIYSGTTAKPEWVILLAPQEGTWTVKVYGKIINSPDEPFIVWISAYTPPVPHDTTPPTTSLMIGSPKYVDPLGNVYITSSTTLTLEAIDDSDTGSGVALTGYKIYNSSYDSGWITDVPPISFEIEGLDDGTYYIDYNSTDNAGNVESTNTTAVTVDNTAPVITETNFEGLALQDGVTLEVSAWDLSEVASVTFSIQCAQGDIIASGSATPTPAEEWEWDFDTILHPDGYYSAIITTTDVLGNMGDTPIQFSIRNWACLELLPASESNKAGRTMPVKFSLRVVASVDPAQPFVYNEELTIVVSKNGDIKQTSTYGTTARDYRINSENELYITNFRTIRKRPATYVVDIYRKDMLIGSFDFSTVK